MKMIVVIALSLVTHLVQAGGPGCRVLQKEIADKNRTFGIPLITVIHGSRQGEEGNCDVGDSLRKAKKIAKEFCKEETQKDFVLVRNDGRTLPEGGEYGVQATFACKM